MNGTAVTWTLAVSKTLDRIPGYLRDKFHYWVDLVVRYGIREVRKQRSFHDEPLKGPLLGRRSVRLNKAYRVIYLETRGDLAILVVEVTKHAYQK